jgi:hypothetical protein
MSYSSGRMQVDREHDEGLEVVGRQHQGVLHALVGRAVAANHLRPVFAHEHLFEALVPRQWLTQQRTQPRVQTAQRLHGRQALQFVELLVTQLEKSKLKIKKKVL